MPFNAGDTVYVYDELANGDTFIAPMTFLAPVGKDAAIVTPKYQYSGAVNMKEVLERLERATRMGKTCAYRIVMLRRCFETKEQAEVSANAMQLHMVTDVHPASYISPCREGDTIYFFTRSGSIQSAQVSAVNLLENGDVLIQAMGSHYASDYGKEFFCSKHAAIMYLDNCQNKSAS